MKLNILLRYFFQENLKIENKLLFRRQINMKGFIERGK